MGIFTFDQQGRIKGFEEKPNAERLAEMKTSVPNWRHHQCRPRQALYRLDGHLSLFSRQRCCSTCWRSPETTSGVS